MNNKVLTGFTKGAWTFKEPKVRIQDALFSTCDIVSGGVRVAKAIGIGNEGALANARLISTAPELLEELQWAVKTMIELANKIDDDAQLDNFREALHNANEIIAKATGE